MRKSKADIANSFMEYVYSKRKKLKKLYIWADLLNGVTHSPFSCDVQAEKLDLELRVYGENFIWMRYTSRYKGREEGGLIFQNIEDATTYFKEMFVEHNMEKGLQIPSRPIKPRKEKHKRIDEMEGIVIPESEIPF